MKEYYVSRFLVAKPGGNISQVNAHVDRSDRRKWLVIRSEENQQRSSEELDGCIVCIQSNKSEWRKVGEISRCKIELPWETTKFQILGTDGKELELAGDWEDFNPKQSSEPVLAA